MRAHASLVGFSFSVLWHAGLAFALFSLAKAPEQSSEARPLDISISVFKTLESGDGNFVESTAAGMSAPAEKRNVFLKPQTESSLVTPLDQTPEQMVDTSSEPASESSSESFAVSSLLPSEQPFIEPASESTSESKPESSDYALLLPAEGLVIESSSEPTVEPEPEPLIVPPTKSVEEKTDNPAPEAPPKSESEYSSVATSELSEKKSFERPAVQSPQVENDNSSISNVPAAALNNETLTDQHSNIESDDKLQQYQSSVRHEVEEAKFYPRKAKRLRQEGSVSVEFSIARNGQVTELQVSNSSNNSELDRAALDAVVAASPFLPLPARFPKDFWRFNLTLNYELN